MERYVRQVAFFGEEKQRRLRQKSVAVVGVGALGSVAAELLARAGVGKLVLIDHDIIELSNLQRQSLYTEADVGKPKAEAAAEKLRAINSEVAVVPRAEHLTAANAGLLMADLVLDCTDNLETRFAINAWCRQNSVPWVHAACAGSIGVVLPVTDDAYCFACVYAHAKWALTCENVGIVNTASFMTASLQVTEALKALLGEDATRGLIRFDIWKGAFDVLRVKRNPGCEVCNGAAKDTPTPQNATMAAGAAPATVRAAADASGYRETTMRGGGFGAVGVKAAAGTQGERAAAAERMEKAAGSEEVRVNGFAFTLAKCTTRAAYSAKPSKNIVLDLQRIKKKFQTVIDTPIVVVINEQGVEVVVHQYGELVFKRCDDMGKMKGIAERVYEAGCY